MNNHDDTSLPDDLSSLEKRLSELSPVSKLDEGRLFYEAGYAAALADSPPARQSTRTTLTAVGSGLFGAAATLLVMFIQTTMAPPQQAQVIDHRPPPHEDSTGRSAPSADPAEAERVEGGSVATSPAPSPADLQQRETSWIVSQQREAEGFHADLAYSTLRLRDQLLSGDEGPAEPNSPPVSFPDSSNIDGSSPAPPNILELQNEYLREFSSDPRVNS